MATKILQGLTYGDKAVCRVYLDDIVVVGRTREELRENTEIVLKRLEEYNIKLSLKKCSFEVEEIEYLGTIVTAAGRSASPKSREAMEKIVRPTTVTQLRSFLGLGQYVAQYIPHYANWAAPMHAAAAARSKQAKITWTAEMERGFEKIKAELREDKHLSFLREDGKLILYTDASDYAIGACLMQVQDGVERPLMFISKSLSKVQRRWSTSDKEMLAIVWAVEKCRFYIGGSSCLVRTDHKALPYSERTSSSKKIERWKLALQEYHLTFEYWKGADNHNADAMSRVTSAIPGEAAQKISLFLAETQDVGFSEEGSSTVDRIKKYHGKHLAHWGVKATWRAMRDDGHEWTNMRGDIATFIRSCDTCQRMKAYRADSTGPKFTTATNEPGETWAVDVKHMSVDPVTGHRFILVVIDMMSRFMYLWPMRSASGDEVLDHVRRLKLLEPAARKIWHDPGREFNNNNFKQFLTENQLNEIQTPTAWKQVNGMVERAIGTATEQLNCIRRDYGVKSEGPWAAYLGQVEGAYNTKVHDGTLVEPCRILRGTGEDRTAAITIAKERIMQLRSKVAKFNMIYREGDLILVRAEDKQKITGPMDRWLGPYRVVECNNMLLTYAEGTRRIEIPYSKAKRYFHESDCRPGAVLLLGPIVLVARDANTVTCKIGEASEYKYEDDDDNWLQEYFR